MSLYVYLAGPVTGCTIGEANDWRNYIIENLPQGVVGINPLRCEPEVGEVYQVSYEDLRFGSAAAITGKNWFDTMRADLVLVYLPKAARLEKGLSIGTMFEIGWASANQKAIIVVTDDEKISEHPLMQRSVNWILPDFDQALDVIEGLLGAYR